MMKIRYLGKSMKPRSTEPTRAGGVSKGLPMGEKITLIPSSMKSIEAEGKQQVVRMRNGVKSPDKGRFYDHPDDTDGQGRNDEGQPEIMGAEVTYGIRGVGPEHIEGPVGKIDHAEHAEDD